MVLWWLPPSRRFHWRGHVGCSADYCLNTYKQMAIMQVNEQANAILQRIRGQLAYMTPENFMFTLKLFLSTKSTIESRCVNTSCLVQLAAFWLINNSIQKNLYCHFWQKLPKTAINDCILKLPKMATIWLMTQVAEMAIKGLICYSIETFSHFFAISGNIVLH